MVKEIVNKAKRVKTLKGWKTVIFNGTALAPLAVDVIGQVANLPDLQSIVPTSVLPYYGLAVGLINIGLRYFTTTPIGKKL